MTYSTKRQPPHSSSLWLSLHKHNPDFTTYRRTNGPSVTRARVKEKCGIAVTTYDTTIDNLISEHVPVIEFSVRAEHISDTSNTGLQASLNLGATEIVCAEFLDQLGREPGAAEVITIGELTLRPDVGPIQRLKDSGWNRLRPFLKSDPGEPANAGVLVAANKPSLEVTT